MSKKSRKQRERKRAQTGDKAMASELLLKQQKNNSARSDSLQYLQQWHNYKYSQGGLTGGQTPDSSQTDPQTKWKFQKSKQVWLLRNMYHLEKVPASNFKTMLLYLDSTQGESKTRVIEEAKQLLEKRDTIPFDKLEQQLIKEMSPEEEQKNLREKITSAKIKRIEKVARKAD